MRKDVEAGRLIGSERKCFMVCILRTTRRQAVSEAVYRHPMAEWPPVERERRGKEADEGDEG